MRVALMRKLSLKRSNKMPEQRVVITIDDEGRVMARTHGFKGVSCVEALDDLLELDGVVGHAKKTDEFHQRTGMQQARKLLNLKRSQ